jgi:hypothetical protein
MSLSMDHSPPVLSTVHTNPNVVGTPVLASSQTSSSTITLSSTRLAVPIRTSTSLHRLPSSNSSHHSNGKNALVGTPIDDTDDLSPAPLPSL